MMAPFSFATEIQQISQHSIPILPGKKVLLLPDRTSLVRSEDKTGKFSRTMVCILTRHIRAKTTIVRPNDAEITQKGTYKGTVSYLPHPNSTKYQPISSQ